MHRFSKCGRRGHMHEKTTSCSRTRAVAVAPSDDVRPSSPIGAPTTRVPISPS
eukprot:COSAG01_NODE_60463_length_294_cov_1.615385_1_plen_52_part_10